MHYRCAQTLTARSGAAAHPINAPQEGPHPHPTTRGQTN
jgi:hypothetical protein